MPFKSDRQRKMFLSALSAPELRRRMNMTLEQIRKMIKHDASEGYQKSK